MRNLCCPNELYNLVSKDAYKKLLLIVSTVDRAIVRDRISKKEKEKELEKIKEIEKEEVRERGRERGREWHEGADSIHRPSGLSKKILSSLSPAEDLWLEKRKQSQITDITRNPLKSPTPTLPVGISVSGYQFSPIIIDDSFDFDGFEYGNRGRGRGRGREDETFSLLESPEMSGLLTERNSDGSSLLLWAAEEGLDELADGLLHMVPSLNKYTDSGGAAALHSACLLGHTQVVATLLSHRCSTLVPDANGWIPVCYALWRENTGSVLLLLKVSDDNSLKQIRALGKLLLQHSKDNRLRNAVMALASIPDLFHLINSLVRRTHTLLDGDHLNFIFAHTNILNLENKLIVARRIISAINHQDNPLEHVHENSSTYNQEYEYEYNGFDTVAYPIIESSPCPNAFILLSRSNPWKALFFFATGFSDSTGAPSDTEHAAHRLEKDSRALLRDRIVFQFTGLGEAGCGPGVEREVIENFSKGLVTSRGNVLEQEQSSDARISNDKIKNSSSSVMYNELESYTMGSNGRKRGREEEGEHSSADEFALFLAFQSSENDKCLYIPVPIRYKVQRDFNIFSSHSESAVTSVKRSRRNLVDENVRTDLKSCPLLKRGFRAFGKIVGHFILRKIASAGRQPASGSAQSSSSSSSSSNCRPDGNDNTVGGGYSLLSFNLPLVFWALVLGGTPGLHDISGFDAELHQNLLWIEENNEVENLSLYFTASAQYRVTPTEKTLHVNMSDTNHPKSFLNESIKVTGCIVDLRPQGSEILVTDDNKAEYLSLMVRHCTVGRFGAQAKAVREGLLSVLPASCLELFNSRELDLLLSVCGTIDPADWRSHTNYQNCTACDSAITWFWKLIEELQPDQLGLLLRFSTGCSRVPLGGFRSLKPLFTITKTELDKKKILPTAATCFNMLRLPEYKDEPSLRKNVMIAILHGSQGFSFS